MAALCYTIAVFVFRFQAYVHANAMMWKVCFKELRALTNTKQLSLSGLNVNPMELNDVYEHVWNVGVLLESDLCLSILEPDYRPWPKVTAYPTLTITIANVIRPLPITGARGRS
jgi:hypothetical protein